MLSLPKHPAVRRIISKSKILNKKNIVKVGNRIV